MLPGVRTTVPLVVAAALSVSLTGCGGNRRANPTAGRLQTVSVQPHVVSRCLQRHGFSTRATNPTRAFLGNIHPRPLAWLQFLGKNGGGVLLFYRSSALAHQGSVRWDREEQARVCRLLNERADCPQGVPRYEIKRTRQTVFINFNLGKPPQTTIETVLNCIPSPPSS